MATLASAAHTGEKLLQDRAGAHRWPRPSAKRISVAPGNRLTMLSLCWCSMGAHPKRSLPPPHTTAPLHTPSCAPQPEVDAWPALSLHQGIKGKDYRRSQTQGLDAGSSPSGQASAGRLLCDAGTSCKPSRASIFLQRVITVWGGTWCWRGQRGSGSLGRSWDRAARPAAAGEEAPQRGPASSSWRGRRPGGCRAAACARCAAAEAGRKPGCTRPRPAACSTATCVHKSSNVSLAVLNIKCSLTLAPHA